MKKAKKKAGGKRRAKGISLRNFTGRVRMNPDKTVSIMGVGKKKKRKK